MAKAHVKKNDMVIVLTGRDRGKKGKVLSVLPKKNLIMVQSIALVTKHIKARREGDFAGVRKEESYINLSNVKRVN